MLGTLYGEKQRPAMVSIVGGLGGKDISAAEFDVVLSDMERAAAGDAIINPRLLYTKAEQERMRTLLRIE